MKSLVTATAAVALAGSLAVPAADVDAQVAPPAPKQAKKKKRKRHQGCQTRRCVQRVAAQRCSQTRVVSCIHRAALRWRVSRPMLDRKARCESGLNPYAVNPSSGTQGVFQFMPGTWASTPYGRHSVFSAKWNSLAAAWMHRVGRGGEWECA